MTGRAVQAIEMVWHDRVFRFLCRCLVAIDTGDCDVSTGQHETRLLVPRQRERRRLEFLFCVAAVTAVEVRSARELLLVRVIVAICATVEFDLVARRLSCRGVALCARDTRMFSAQWKSREVVFRKKELGGLEPLNGVARLAFSSIGPFCKLPIMRIGLVAIGTLLEGNLLLEIAPGMALDTSHLPMLPQ